MKLYKIPLSNNYHKYPLELLHHCCCMNIVKTVSIVENYLCLFLMPIGSGKRRLLSLVRKSAEYWQTWKQVLAVFQVGEHARAQAAGATHARSLGAVQGEPGSGAESGWGGEAFRGEDGQLAKGGNGGGNFVGCGGRSWRGRGR